MSSLYVGVLDGCECIILYKKDRHGVDIAFVGVLQTSHILLISPHEKWREFQPTLFSQFVATESVKIEMRAAFNMKNSCNSDYALERK